MTRAVLQFLTGLLILLGTSSWSPAQVVIARKQLGNTTEAMTFVHTGSLAGSAVVLDNDQVVAVKAHSTRPLFSVLPLPVNIGPRGMAFIETEQTFVFDDATQVNSLFLTDIRGHLRGTIPITYLNDYVPEWIEGLVWLPPSSPMYPNHFLLVAVDLSTAESRLEVIQRDGQVAAEIIPQIPLAEGQFIVGLGYEAPGTLLAGAVDGTLWRIDFQGTILAGPGSVPNLEDFEGVAQVSAGRIAVIGLTGGRVTFLDAGFQPLPIAPWSYKVGYGLSGPVGVAWDPSIGYLVQLPSGAAPSTAAQVVALKPWFEFQKQVVDLTDDLTARRLTYLPDEHLIAISHINCGGTPEGCFTSLFNETGALVEKIPMPYGFPSITYIPSTHQFAEVHGGLLTIEVFSRTGVPVRTIDLTETGIDAVSGFTYFNPSHPSGGEFLILGSGASHKAFITDFNGNLLSTFDYKEKLGAMEAMDVATIASGPFGHLFVLVEVENSEILTFYLPR